SGAQSSKSSPDFCLAKLLQQQFFERRVRTSHKEVDSPARAELAQALTKVLDGLLINFQSITAEGHLLLGAGLRIDQAQVAKFHRRQFLGSEYLNCAYLTAAHYQTSPP